MNGAILIENEFENDITKIEFYGTEERKTTQNIIYSLENFNNLYKSRQMEQLNNLKDDLDINVQTIDRNRQEYCRILKQVIVRYQEAASRTVDIMEKK